MDIANWRDLPTTRLGHWPTPLEPLDRLSEELGGPRIWLKRDDCTGLAIGGNKTRKLEYLLGDALAQQADTVVTFGAVQSNHARQTAAACAKTGLICHQVLARSVANNNPRYESGGNVLLGQLLGAKTHLVDVDQSKTYTEQLLKQLNEEGRSVYVIPAGGSNAIGALGYANCAAELAHQCQQHKIALTYVLHASSSAGTQAGLIFGLQQLKMNTHVQGINVYHQDPQALENRVSRLLTDMTKRFSSGATSNNQIHVNHAYFGEGYGQPTKECLQAIKMVAQLEGVLFDPVYSGKALAAMIDQVTLGNLNAHSDVILLHTGGTPALNVYEEAFL
jgi:L-cysteate sulfo-lyase